MAVIVKIGKEKIPAILRNKFFLSYLRAILCICYSLKHTFFSDKISITIA